MGEKPLFSQEEIEDMAHRMRCHVANGSMACTCADYAAVTALLNPDCPKHGYVERPKKRKEVG